MGKKLYKTFAGGKGKIKVLDATQAYEVAKENLGGFTTNYDSYSAAPRTDRDGNLILGFGDGRSTRSEWYDRRVFRTQESSRYDKIDYPQLGGKQSLEKNLVHVAASKVMGGIIDEEVIAAAEAAGHVSYSSEHKPFDAVADADLAVINVNGVLIPGTLTDARMAYINPDGFSSVRDAGVTQASFFSGLSGKIPHTGRENQILITSYLSDIYAKIPREQRTQVDTAWLVNMLWQNRISNGRVNLRDGKPVYGQIDSLYDSEFVTEPHRHFEVSQDAYDAWFAHNLKDIDPETLEKFFAAMENADFSVIDFSHLGKYADLFTNPDKNPFLDASPNNAAKYAERYPDMSNEEILTVVGDGIRTGVENQLDRMNEIYKGQKGNT